MNDRVKELLQYYSADGLITAYRRNRELFEQYVRNADNMAGILDMMEDELIRRGIDYGDLSQNSNAV